MISYEDAIDVVRQCGQAYRLGCEKVSLEKIAGRVSATEVMAPMANQPFDNSAMDGYALLSDDLVRASHQRPVHLKIVGRILAGEPAPLQAVEPGHCYEIMTGAPMPPGCDTVVAVENTEKQHEYAVFWAPSCIGSNVRLAGADFVQGELLLNAGTALTVNQILPLATLGIAEVDVMCRPRVAVLSTGLEVVDELGKTLKPGQIYNASAPYLREMLPALGAEADFFGTVADEPEAFRGKLAEMLASKPDILVTTGAVSAGVCDFIRAELEAQGAEILFHKVKMRPGKPLLFARLADNGPFFIGLPGNPVASAAGLRFFVYPLMRAMLGLPPETPRRTVLKHGATSKKAEFRMFLRAVLQDEANAIQQVEILQKQQSFMVSAFMRANGWVVAAEGVAEISPGDLVDFFPFLPD
ncbi:MAG: molybdopterin molybdotransferase MoeA [Pseudomonadales bacterium]